MGVMEKSEFTEIFGQEIGSEKFLNPKKGTVEVRSEVIGRILKHLRTKAGLTQNDVSQKIGIAQQTYAGYESGKHQPNIELLIRLADIYDMPLDYISGRYIGVEEDYQGWDEVKEKLDRMEKYYALKHKDEAEFLKSL